MTSVSDEFDRQIAEMEELISKSLEDHPADDRLFTLRDFLLAQLRVCALHYRLMLLESKSPLLFDDTSFARLIAKHLEISQFFRQLPKCRDKSTYEMKSIISLYNFIEHHSAE